MFLGGSAVWCSWPIRDMFYKAMDGQELTLEDVAHLQDDLLDLSVEMLSQSKTQPAGKQLEKTQIIRGHQMRLGIHLLNARSNLRHGEILQHARPALPRDEIPHTRPPDNLKSRWNIALSRHSFLDQIHCVRLFPVSISTEDELLPDITVISGKNDLGAQTSGNIIAAAITESQTNIAFIRSKVTDRLNEFERRFYQKLGWDRKV